jgi:hypothetical protein
MDECRSETPLAPDQQERPAYVDTQQAERHNSRMLNFKLLPPRITSQTERVRSWQKLVSLVPTNQRQCCKTLRSEKSVSSVSVPLMNPIKRQSEIGARR